jgi:hypothetical protein
MQKHDWVSATMYFIVKSNVAVLQERHDGFLDWEVVRAGFCDA